MKKIVLLFLSAAILLFSAGCAIDPNTSSGEIIGGADNSTGILVTTDNNILPAEIVHEYFFNNDEYCTYYMTLKALDPNGDVMWEYTSPNCLVGQCEGLQCLGMKNGLVYINEIGIYDHETMNGDFRLCISRLRALNASDGTVAWDNNDFDGSGACAVFDEEGNIYAAGYFSPDCIKIDRSGSTVWHIPYIDQNLYWVYQLSYENGIITIYYEMNENFEADTVQVYSSDGTLVKQ